MSRCFPYPPPGFQRTDHSDLLAKEKHKERKHKREKERKEGKERKDKDRSEDKHKEKKDRKEKHKDKKRDKAKDKDKSKTSDNRRTQGRTDDHSGQNATLSIPKSEEIKYSTFAEERGKRIRYEQEGAAKRLVENISAQIQVQHLGAAYIWEMEIGNGNMIPKFLSKEQGRVDGVGSIATTTAILKERGNGNPTVTNFNSKEQSKCDDNGGAGKLVEKGNHYHQDLPQLPVERGNHNHQVLARPSVGKDAIKSISGKEKVTETDDGKGDRQRDRDQEKRNKGKDKIKDREKEKEKTDDGKRNRHGDRDHEKKSKGNDKNRDKVKGKEEEKMEKDDNNQKVPNKPKDIGETNRPDSQNCKTIFSQKNNECFGGNDGLGKKRKHIGTNGFLHEDAVRPNKAPKQASSSHQPLENGKTLALDHISSSPLERHVNPTIVKEEKVINNKEHKKNGFVQAHLSAVDLKPLASDTSAVLPRPPHPDFKYLRQVYSVPQMEEWPEYDDQEWLFSGSNPQPKPEAGQPLQVWAKGLQIELVDVFALPYVIPY
ncbi:myb-like protein X [Iris pallida]|uniref:Myb-like protein X n=1 Tax=Iris pallida TaxID=29817 RepID=A0AAX6GTJ4_IRIPA|nr:myb-like protein X [Iris pallida]